MGGRAILCVDDEAVILLSLVQELKNAFGSRFLYEKATSADDALEIIDDLAADGVRVILVISDWLMPGIKGDAFLEMVRQKYPDIKAIMITGHADLDIIGKVGSLDSVLAVLKKPWSSRELTGLIAGACAD